MTVVQCRVIWGCNTRRCALIGARAVLLRPNWGDSGRGRRREHARTQLAVRQLRHCFGKGFTDLIPLVLPLPYDSHTVVYGVLWAMTPRHVAPIDAMEFWRMFSPFSALFGGGVQVRIPVLLGAKPRANIVHHAVPVALRRPRDAQRTLAVYGNCFNCF